MLINSSFSQESGLNRSFEELPRRKGAVRNTRRGKAPEGNFEDKLNQVMTGSKSHDIKILKNEIQNKSNIKSEQKQGEVQEQNISLSKLKVLSKRTRKKSYICLTVVITICVLNMIWCVLNGIVVINGKRGTIYTKVFLISSYLAAWSVLLLCYWHRDKDIYKEKVRRSKKRLIKKKKKEKEKERKKT